jgi:hypothetical protein
MDQKINIENPYDILYENLCMEETYSNKTSTTFVTSFVDIYENIYANKDTEWRFNKFREIAETGINICLYVSIESMIIAVEYAKEFPNIKIMQIITIGDSWISRICDQYDDIQIPLCRNEKKDTREYLLLMNAKIEYLRHAIKVNPFKTSHFSWIDFNISYIFKNLKETQHKLKWLSQCTTLTKTFLAFPGCTSPLQVNDNIETTDDIFDNICWRFCGGFFIGDKASVLYMHELYTLHFPSFMFKYRKLVWEVNFWAWMEATTFYKNQRWCPDWYLSDHDDTIFDIPVKFYAVNLSESPVKKTTYNYPAIDGFIPTSASYFKSSSGKKILNTRYVNYEITSNGYVYNNNVSFPVSKNIFSELDSEYIPKSFNIMTEPVEASSPLNPEGIQGLEDLRLFEDERHIKFTATSFNYSMMDGISRIIRGDYDTQSFILSQREVIQPPEESYCEKNWIPFSSSVGNPIPEIIYKWNPLIIGKIIDRIFVPDRIFKTSFPNYMNVRGSSTMTDMGDGTLLGVIHFSTNKDVLSYYHILVSQNRDTLEPLCFSDVFYFEKVGVEFCLGFTAEHGGYRFWISRNDKDPMMITVDSKHIPLRHSFNII